MNLKLLQILKRIKEYFNHDQKILLAFEYGVILSETARKRGVKLTPEIMQRAEVMIAGEFKNNSNTRLAVDMSPNILSVFELDLNK